MFGVLDLESELLPGMSKSLGFRPWRARLSQAKTFDPATIWIANDLSLPWRSLVILKAKHTWGFSLDQTWGFSLDQRITIGLEKWEKTSLSSGTKFSISRNGRLPIGKRKLSWRKRSMTER
jgi:hypothetical protein